MFLYNLIGMRKTRKDLSSTYFATLTRCPDKNCPGLLVYDYDRKKYLCFQHENRPRRPHAHPSDLTGIIYRGECGKTIYWSKIIDYVLKSNPRLRRYDSIDDACLSLLRDNGIHVRTKQRHYFSAALKNYMEKNPGRIKK